jgi:hypothetical protein
MSFNMSPFKYFKSVSAGMYQSFDFLAYLCYFKVEKKDLIDQRHSACQKH